jgi:hypothetical protein
MEDIPFFNGKSAYRSYMNQAVYCTMIIDYFFILAISVKDINFGENRIGNREWTIQRHRQHYAQGTKSRQTHHRKLKR